MCSHDAGHILKTVKKCNGSKILASVHKMPEKSDNGRKFDGTLMPKKCTFVPEKCTFEEMYVLWHRSVSFPKRQKKYSVFKVFKCSHDAVFNMFRLELHFQIYHLQNPPSKSVPFSIFTVFKMCRHHMNAV